MREIFVERQEELLRIAITENNQLSECFVEEPSEEPQIGEIYKGRIKNIIPGINSVFVDIGLDKEGYMYYSNELKLEKIKKGDEILVEIVKEPLNGKGAKLTKKISIPGRFMVITLGEKGIGFSKRITSSEEKSRINNSITEVDGVGILIRTEAVYASDEDLQQEKDNLLMELDRVTRKLKYSLKLGKIYGDNIILGKVLRDRITEETKILVDNEEDYAEVKNYLDNRKGIEVILFKEARNLFDYYGIEKEVLKLRHNKVNLNCGGNIVIEKTEAMCVIDVNSAKNTKGRNFNKTILETNLEAAKEIGRQIRLRNLSGIIVIDFIDMRDFSHEEIVMKALKESLASDKGNVKIFPFTELDIVQIARRRRGKSIYDYLDEPCKKCKGNGYVLKLSYIENLLKNEIIKFNEENSINDFYIELDKNYKESIEGDIFNFLKNIYALDKAIYLNFVDGIEGFKLEPIIFNRQKEIVKKFRVTGYEKYE